MTIEKRENTRKITETFYKDKHLIVVEQSFGEKDDVRDIGFEVWADVYCLETGKRLATKMMPYNFFGLGQYAKDEVLSKEFPKCYGKK